jgi:hypothetical protein
LTKSRHLGIIVKLIREKPRGGKRIKK